jgi:hypothetical protein
MLGAAIPVLPARDIDEAVASYSRLGFKAGYADNDYAVLARDGAEPHFFRNADAMLAEHTMARLKSSAIEAFHALRATAGCVHPNGALALKPWGMREFSVLDPSGVCITVQEEKA